MIFYDESKFKIKQIFFFGGGGDWGRGRARVSDFLQRIQI